MKYRIAFLVVLAVILVASATFAGGPSGPRFGLSVNGLHGWEGQTSSYMEGLINPPFFNEGEGNIPFVYPPHSDQFTVAYWLDGENKLALQTHATPNPAGDMQFEGKIEVGVNDIRTSITLDWWIDEIPDSPTPLAWWVSVYRNDIHSNVFSRLVLPEEGSIWVTTSMPMSISGYDILAVAFNPNPVPEPSAFIALGAGCLGLAGLVRRKRS